MSYLVLHMDKFKRESLRGIQSHNRHERSKSSSFSPKKSRASRSSSTINRKRFSVPKWSGKPASPHANLRLPTKTMGRPSSRDNPHSPDLARGPNIIKA